MKVSKNRKDVIIEFLVLIAAIMLAPFLTTLFLHLCSTLPGIETTDTGKIFCLIIFLFILIASWKTYFKND